MNNNDPYYYNGRNPNYNIPKPTSSGTLSRDGNQNDQHQYNYYNGNYQRSQPYYGQPQPYTGNAYMNPDPYHTQGPPSYGSYPPPISMQRHQYTQSNSQLPVRMSHNQNQYHHREHHNPPPVQPYFYNEENHSNNRVYYNGREEPAISNKQTPQPYNHPAPYKVRPTVTIPVNKEEMPASKEQEAIIEKKQPSVPEVSINKSNNDSSSSDDDSSSSDSDESESDEKTEDNTTIQGTNISLQSEEDIAKWREERKKMWLLKISNNKERHIKEMGVDPTELKNASVLEKNKRDQKFIRSIQSQVQNSNTKKNKNSIVSGKNINLAIVQREMASENEQILQFIKELGDAKLLEYELTEDEKKILFKNSVSGNNRNGNFRRNGGGNNYKGNGRRHNNNNNNKVVK